MTNAGASTTSILIDFLRSAQGIHGPIHVDTDLIESGMLDSLLIMDLVSFLDSRFGVCMQPGDINPGTLRSVACIARFVEANTSSASDAA